MRIIEIFLSLSLSSVVGLKKGLRLLSLSTAGLEGAGAVGAVLGLS